MKKIILLLSIIALGFTSSCDETKKVIDVAGSVQLSGNYEVTSISGFQGAESKEGDALSLSFSAIDKSIRGNTGCNTFFGNYTIDLYVLSIGDLAVTEKACSDEIMAKQNAYLSALSNVGSYRLQNNRLTLLSKTDRSELLTAIKETRE